MAPDELDPEELGGDPPCWAHLFEEEEADDDQAGAGRTGPGVVADLGPLPTSGGSGVLWSLPHGGDLDANLVRLEPGAQIAEHRNDEVDVLIYVQSGTGSLSVDGAWEPLAADHIALVPKGARRAIEAGRTGLVYLSAHRSRGPLTIKGRRSGQDR